MNNFLFDNIRDIWMALAVIALILGLIKKWKFLQIGKSLACFAFLFANWVLIYTVAFRGSQSFGPLWNISDVWRWFPAVLCFAALVICLIEIWKPFGSEHSRKVILCISIVMMLLTLVTILLWQDDGFSPPYVMIHTVYDDSIFDEFWRILYWTWHFHLVSFAFTIIIFLSFSNNLIVGGITKSILFAYILAVGGVLVTAARWSPQAAVWNWLVGIVCFGVFLALLYFIWKPLILKRRGVADKADSAC